MMCGKKSKRRWQLLALCLSLLAFSLPAFSQDAKSQVLDPVAEFLAQSQEIARKHPDVKPQLLKMADALQAISDRSASKIDQHQTIIDRQAQTLDQQAQTISQQQRTIEKQAQTLTESDATIATLQQSQKDYEGSVTAERLGLKTDLGNAETSATIGWTVAGLGWLGDVIQLVLHGFKLW